MWSQKLGQIIEKPFEHIFGSIFMKLAQNDNLYEILVRFEYGLCGIKN